MKFSEQIKTVRESLGLNQAEAAAILGCGKRTLEHWEAGTRTPLEITQEGAMNRLRATQTNPNQTKPTDAKISCAMRNLRNNLPSGTHAAPGRPAGTKPKPPHPMTALSILSDLGLQLGTASKSDVLAAYRAADDGGTIQAHSMVTLMGPSDPTRHTTASLTTALRWLGCTDA